MRPFGVWGSLLVLVCVGVVCFEDVEEAVDVRLSCGALYFFFVLLVDAYFFEIPVHGFFVDSFGAYNEV